MTAIEPDGRRVLHVFGPGRMGYREAFSLQQRLLERCLESEGTENSLLLLEHPPVITLGRSAGDGELRAPACRLREMGVEVVETNRGGRATFHGPGQLVAYPIIDLAGRGRDLHRYLRELEQWLVALLEGYGVRAHALEGRTGVWVGGHKIASVGIAVRRWVSYHGAALNVAPEMSFFLLINPCGFAPRTMTSMEELLGWAPSLEEVAREAARLFRDRFGFPRFCEHALQEAACVR